MHRFTLLCGALAALLLPGIHAQSHQHQGGASAAERAAQAELGAAAIFDPQGRLWVVHQHAGNLVVRHSADRGRTWSQPVPVGPGPEATDTGGDARPKIALGPAGEIYITWTRPMTKPYTGEIRFSRSLDRGKTFLGPVTVHRDRQEITHRFDAITVNPQGQIFVAWIDKRDGVAAAKASGPSYRGAAVYFAVSDDRGATFRGDFKLADHSCECCRIALVPHRDGTVSALWRHIFAPNIRDHAMARLLPDGKPGEVRRATFEDWHVDACPHHGPSLAEDGTGRLHAVWFSLAPESTGVFYGRLTQGGVEGLRRVGRETAEHADLAVKGDQVAVAWKEFDGERSLLRGMMSKDGGENWQEHELASTGGASDQPRVVTFQDRFHVLWNTRNEPLSVIAFP
jgi:hypothetical protein